jgi:uncharacterized protein (TIGR02118 family)
MGRSFSFTKIFQQAAISRKRYFKVLEEDVLLAIQEVFVVYKLIAYWTAPASERVESFEEEYWSRHVPLAADSPGLTRLVLTRTTDGLEDSPPAFYRIAELCWDSEDAFKACAASKEWAALREDAGRLIDEYGVQLAVGLGNEHIHPLH